MTNYLVLSLIVGYCLLLSACDSESMSSEVVIDQVIFVPGGTHTYESREVVYTQDENGAFITLHESIDTLVVEVVSSPEIIPGFDGAVQIDEYFQASPDIRNSRWFIQSDSQLVEVAYRDEIGAPIDYVTLKAPMQHSLSLLSGSLPGMQDVLAYDIVVRDQPHIILTYPLETGRSWVGWVLDTGNSSVIITRTVLETAQVDTPAGRFTGITLETAFSSSSNPDSITYRLTDYVTSDGLVQRTSLVDLPAPNEFNPDGGPATAEWVLTLVGVNE